MFPTVGVGLHRGALARCSRCPVRASRHSLGRVFQMILAALRLYIYEVLIIITRLDGGLDFRCSSAPSEACAKLRKSAVS